MVTRCFYLITTSIKSCRDESYVMFEMMWQTRSLQNANVTYMSSHISEMYDIFTLKKTYINNYIWCGFRRLFLQMLFIKHTIYVKCYNKIRKNKFFFNVVTWRVLLNYHFHEIMSMSNLRITCVSACQNIFFFFNWVW